MARIRLTFTCSTCGSGFPRWSGRCPQCGEWNTLNEERAAAAQARRAGRDEPTGASAVPLAAVSLDAGTPRPTGLGEVDRVLSGGLVPGSVTLLGGEPGVGKSTLVFQLAAGFADEGRRALLASGEETASQVRRRAERLGGAPAGLDLIATGSLADVLAACRQSPPSCSSSIRSRPSPTTRRAGCRGRSAR